ncbi:porin family protein [Flavobacterium alvei]|uniref:porin family protein n=1 Tax=Flavobacterium alvei TaxID=2080416 RepID=UPI0026ED34A2|nr:porin family protein [Flavobacterium alvei]
MKKLLLLMSLVSIGFTNAQTKNKGTFEITPKIGYSSFNEINENGSTDSNSGVEFGATTDYYFNNRWSLRSGLVFDKMGGEYEFFGDKYEDKLNYLSIPINANWHFGSTRKWNLNFGVSPSFLVGAKVNDTKIPSGTIKTFQLGFTYGIGYKIEITKTFGILLDYQGFSGLTNINEISGIDYRNSGGSFNVGGVIEL